MSFLVLTISLSHFGVSGQYIQYNAKAHEAQSVTESQIDTATVAEYEYYDDIIEDSSTTQIPAARTTTTTTTTTPKPITSYRFLTNHRNGFRPINFNKKKLEITTRQYHTDSHTEASNESAFVQNQSQLKQPTPPTPPPHLRNAIADINRRTVGKDYAQEKSSATSFDSNNGNGNYLSRRYARFLFKQRTG